MPGVLHLVPTPLNDSDPLEATVAKWLSHASENDQHHIVVEEHKEARRRWLAWGLARECIDQFILYNEHNQNEALTQLLSLLQSGKNLYLFSDGGLPVFCDPGQKLVQACHQSGISVKMGPVPNALTMALCLSGFPCSPFWFEGFLPRETGARQSRVEQMAALNYVMAFYEAPYRLNKLVALLGSVLKNREIFLALDLTTEQEELCRGPAQQLAKRKDWGKREVVVVIGPS